ncbi:MAG: glycosyltransferase family 2 protein [Acidobacteriota bacterium]|nr:glycosyltransferase family 2 protein [Blastocatellia bacterium]MDW8411963.1 glycosyltransferase family 2 protein [Acidobacteriota bacterium]
MQQVAISVVVPVFNEEETLEELYRRLRATLQSLGKDYEIIFVDDGSNDASLKVMKRIRAADTAVRVVKLTRNFGQHPAIVAGLHRARGEAVVLIDADLQNPPEEISRLYEKYLEGYDVVYGIREGRSDASWRLWGSKLVMRLSKWLLGLPVPEDMISGFRIISRKVVNTLNTIHEQQYDTSLMMVYLGFSHAGVQVKHDVRRYGQSKYSTFKLIYLTLDMLVGFSDFPLRAASYTGAAMAVIAIAVGSYMAVRRLLGIIDVPGYASIFVGITFLAGIQLLFLGVIGEYISRIYREMKGRPYYVVDEEF